MNTFTFEHMEAAGTYILKPNDGILHAITINTTANGTITVYDSATATGKKIAVLKASVVEGSYIYDINFINGLTIVLAGASDVTVSFT
jgi:hypothetical protein